MIGPSQHGRGSVKQAQPHDKLLPEFEAAPARRARQTRREPGHGTRLQCADNPANPNR